MSETLFTTIVNELEKKRDDLRPSDIPFLSEPLRSAVNFVLRLNRFSLTEFHEKLPQFSRDETQKIADILIRRKLFALSPFATENEPSYESRLSAMTRPLSRPPSDIWSKLD